MSDRLRVSVLMAAYNAGPFVREAVESVLAQPEPDIEVVVADDGSTDGTGAILDSFAGRARVVHTPNAGAAAARNRAWRECSGAYVLIMDADDRMPADALRSRREFLERDDRVDVAYGDTRRIGEGGEPLDLVPLRRTLAAGEPAFPAFVPCNLFPVHAALARRRVFERLGGPHAEGIDLVGDWDLWARAAAEHFFAYVPGVVAEYRIHPAMSLRQLDRSRGLAQSFATLERIVANPAFAAVGRRDRVRALVNLALLAGRLGRWDRAAAIAAVGLESAPLEPRLRALRVLAVGGGPLRPLRRHFVERWG